MDYFKNTVSIEELKNKIKEEGKEKIKDGKNNKINYRFCKSYEEIKSISRNPITEEYKLMLYEVYSSENELLSRKFLNIENNLVSYVEIFENGKNRNKYISKLENKNGNFIGYRIYSDDPIINKNLKYITIYKEENKFNILEKNIKGEYIDIVKQCIKNKNIEKIGDDISGLDKETTIYSTILKEINNNKSIFIYNDTDNNTFKEGWFKGRDKKSLLNDLGITIKNEIIEEYLNKVILIPVSQDGHATVMLIDTNFNNKKIFKKQEVESENLLKKERYNIKDIKIYLFDSSYYHKSINPFQNRLKENIFGKNLSKEIEVINKTNILKDLSMFLKIGSNTGYDINTNFGYLQENGTCLYWQNAFIKTICDNAEYNSINKIKEGIKNGEIIKKMCLEMNNTFIPYGIFKEKLEESDKENEYFKICSNGYNLYIKKDCYKNQFVNLAKLRQRLKNPKELNNNEFNEQIKKQKILRKELKIFEDYNKITEYYRRLENKFDNLNMEKLKSIKNLIKEAEKFCYLSPNDLLKKVENKIKEGSNNCINYLELIEKNKVKEKSNCYIKSLEDFEKTLKNRNNEIYRELLYFLIDENNISKLKKFLKEKDEIILNKFNEVFNNLNKKENDNKTKLNDIKSNITDILNDNCDYLVFKNKSFIKFFLNILNRNLVENSNFEERDLKINKQKIINILKSKEKRIENMKKIIHENKISENEENSIKSYYNIFINNIKSNEENKDLKEKLEGTNGYKKMKKYIEKKLKNFNKVCKKLGFNNKEIKEFKKRRIRQEEINQNNQLYHEKQNDILKNNGTVTLKENKPQKTKLNSSSKHLDKYNKRKLEEKKSNYISK